MAVYGGSRVTMPYAMAVMGTAMMDEFFSRPPTLGDTILGRRRMMAPLDEKNTINDLTGVLSGWRGP